MISHSPSPGTRRVMDGLRSPRKRALLGLGSKNVLPLVRSLPAMFPRIAALSVLVLVPLGAAVAVGCGGLGVSSTASFSVGGDGNGVGLGEDGGAAPAPGPGGSGRV